MNDSKKIKFFLYSAIACWATFIIFSSLLFSPIGRTKGPMSPVLMVLLPPLLLSWPMALVGTIVSFIETIKTRNKLNSISLGLNAVYILFFSTVCYRIFSSAMGV